MKKGRKRVTAWFLALCMILSLVTGIPVQAKEPDDEGGGEVDDAVAGYYVGEWNEVEGYIDSYYSSDADRKIYFRYPNVIEDSENHTKVAYNIIEDGEGDINIDSDMDNIEITDVSETESEESIYKITIPDNVYGCHVITLYLQKTNYEYKDEEDYEPGDTENQSFSITIDESDEPNLQIVEANETEDVDDDGNKIYNFGPDRYPVLEEIMPGDSRTFALAEPGEEDTYIETNDEGWVDISFEALGDESYTYEKLSDNVGKITFNEEGVYVLKKNGGGRVVFVVSTPKYGFYYESGTLDLDKYIGEPISLKDGSREFFYNSAEKYRKVEEEEEAEEEVEVLHTIKGFVLANYDEENDDFSYEEISDSEEFNEKIKYEKVAAESDVNSYKFIVSGLDNDISVDIAPVYGEDEYGNLSEDPIYGPISHIDITIPMSGLVISHGGIFENQENTKSDELDSFGKEWYMGIKQNNYCSIGVVSEDGEKVSAVGANEIGKFTILDKAGNMVSADIASLSVANYWSDEEDTWVKAQQGFFVLWFEESGDYRLAYDGNGDGNPDDYINLTVGLPDVGIYRGGEATEEECLGESADYDSDNKEFWVNSRTDEEAGPIKIKYVWVSDGTDNNVTYDYKEGDSNFKVKIGEKKIAGFELTVFYWQGEDPGINEDASEEDGYYGTYGNYGSYSVRFNPSGDFEVLAGDLILDGEPQLGFSGCYIQEDWFENGSWSSEIEIPQYYVHADSIQGVIDKLSKVSVGDSIEGYVMDGHGNRVKATDKLLVENTGYISVQVSTFGDIPIEPQYVASSGNLKGIIFSGDTSHIYFVKPDDKYKTVTGLTGGRDDYAELGVFNSDTVFNALVSDNSPIKDTIRNEEKEAIKGADGIIWSAVGDEDKWGLYAAERHDYSYSNRDVGEKTGYYYTFKGTEPILAYSETWSGWLSECCDPETNDTNARLNQVEDIRIAESMAGLHVNAYCDMKFTGDMGKLVIGYPDKALASKDGNSYFSTELDYEDETVKIDGNTLTDDNNPNKPESYPNEVTVSGSTTLDEEQTGDDNYKSNYEYKLRTYAIKSESSTSGTFEGVEVVAPEPNALTELSESQKDAIEAGKTLSVSMTADEVDENSAGAAAKEEINAIEKAVADDSKEYGRIDFIDLSVKASVDGQETKITETAVPMEVTIPIPKGYKGNNFRIARYHNGKIFFFDLVKVLRNEIAGLNIGYVINEKDRTITFLTDRFSTYALMEVGEDSREEVDFSKANWNYTSAFTADGTAKKVELTGIPDGVNVTYSDNEKTEAGKYTAKATFKVTDEKSYKLPDNIPERLLSLAWEITKKSDTPAEQKPTEEPASTPKAGETITDETTKATFKVTTPANATTKGEVTYTGSSDSAATSVKIPATIKAADGTEYKVTAVADGAFKNNKTVKNVTIESGVITIGANAFSGCTKLTSVSIPNTVVTIGSSAFESDTALKNVTIPASVTEIGAKAFKKCTKMTKAVVGKSVKKIGASAFEGDSALKTVSFKGAMVETIGDAAFKNCKKLSSIVIPKAVKSIGKNAFNGDKKLKKITFKGNNVKKIGKTAFKGVPKKATAKVPKKKLKAYKKLLKKAKFTGKVKK